MEKITGKLNTDNVKIKGRAQIEVDCELLSDKPIISLLGVSADSVARSAEGVENQANVTGRVNFKAVFVSEENELCALDYYTDFSTMVGIDGESVHKLFAFAKVLEVRQVSAGENSINLKAIVELEIIGVNKRSMDWVDVPELCTKYQTRTESELKEIAEGEFEVSEEYESGGRVDKIILLDTDLILKECKPTRESLLVSGTAVANLTYSTDKGIKSLSLSMPFCEEIEGESFTPDDDVYLYGYVRDSRIVLSGDDENNVIKLEVTVAVRVPVFTISETQVLVDAYSIDKEIKLVTKESDSYKKTGDWNWEERLSGTVSIPEDAPDVARVLSLVFPRDAVSAVLSGSDKINVLGSACALLVYEDGEGLIRSTPVELPYAVEIDATESTASGETYLRTAICDMTTAVKRAREVEVMYVLKIYAYQCVREKVCCVVDVEELSERTGVLPITIYKKREGSDNWKVGKALRVPIKAVEESEDGFVTCYRQLE